MVMPVERGKRRAVTHLGLTISGEKGGKQFWARSPRLGRARWGEVNLQPRAIDEAWLRQKGKGGYRKSEKRKKKNGGSGFGMPFLKARSANVRKIRDRA